MARPRKPRVIFLPTGHIQIPVSEDEPQVAGPRSTAAIRIKTNGLAWRKREKTPARPVTVERNRLGESMKLSRASGYALQAIVAMTAGEDGALVASQLTAEAESIPGKFLLKLFRPLVKAGILHSRKGPGGGYHLARPAVKITLLEIIEAIDGPLIRLPLRIRGTGTDTLDKRLAEICQKVTAEARRQLGKVTVADLAKSGKGKK